MSETPGASNRFLSLDALRGYTIALMVIVNDPGSWKHVYAPLRHADWHGITLTDVVFPFFLLIVGVSITLAYTKRLAAGAEKKDLYRKIAARAAKIMLLGWFLWLWPTFEFDGLRYAGVLPRIAVVFLVCSVIFLHTNWKQQVWIASVTLVAYWLLMAFVPVPIDDVVRDALATGQVRYSGGMLDIGPLRQMSDGFPAIVSGVIGMLIGKLILSIEGPHRKLTWMFFIGFSMYLAGGVWGWFMPLNKNLWSSSYTLWTAGVCTMGLAASILAVDILGYSRVTKLGRVYGANAITSYVLAGMLTLVFYSPIFGGTSLSGLWMAGVTGTGVPPKLASLGYAVVYMFVIYVPAYLLYRKRIFIRV